MKYVVVTGDRAIFEPVFAPATLVAPPPGIMSGTAKAKVFGAPACAVGDEASVTVTASYVVGASAPGTGLLRISSLAGDQRSTGAKSGGRPLILVGSRFQATLTVSSPAILQGSPVDSVGTVYSGGGSFASSNSKTKG